MNPEKLIPIYKEQLEILKKEEEELQNKKSQRGDVSNFAGSQEDITAYQELQTLEKLETETDNHPKVKTERHFADKPLGLNKSDAPEM